jgi:uncharacterized membrane protein
MTTAATRPVTRSRSTSGPPEQQEATREPVFPTIVGAAFAVANVVALNGGHLRFVGPALVFWLMLIYPAYLLATTDFWGGRSVAERLGLGLVGALLLLLVGGLTVNTFLPLLGVSRPLATIPVLVLVDAIDVGLWLVRRRRPAHLVVRFAPGLRGARETRVLVLGGVCALLMVLGANRLNNGGSAAVTMAGLGVALIVIVLLLVWTDRLRTSVVAGALYLLSAALLLMTSLRGWSVTGHDIQLEYRVFQLTAAHGKWDMSLFQNPYNACLSITLLPTQMAALLHVDDPYVYKVFFQLMFAACPVMVFVLARRYFSVRVSVLAVVYFIGFPTFFTDMPFLNRQEMAFLFVSAGFLIITTPLWGKRQRQALLVVAAIGVELCHYSSSYVFFGTLLVAWGGQALFARGWPPAWTRANLPESEGGRWSSAVRTIGVGSLVVILAVIVLWGGVVTKTANGVVGEVRSAVTGFVHHNGGEKASSVGYGLVPGGSSVGNSQSSDNSQLEQYREQTLAARAKAAPGTFIPLSVVDRYQMPVVAQPDLPVTAAGRALSRVGVAPSKVNEVMRSLAAKGEQVFLLIGMVALLLSKRRRGTVGREYYYLCAAAIVALAAITFLPNLSVDYGLLRVFQQALLVIAPVIVVGSLTLFQPLGAWWSRALATSVGLAIFASTTGLIPQALGGYPAQLNLNNSGQYYDLYYMTPQQVGAVDWLMGKPGTLPSGIQVDDYPAERFAFTSPSTVTGRQYLTDLFPSFLQYSSWALVDTSMLQSGTATVSINGNYIAYRYPFDLLNREKNLVFTNGGTRIYQ